MAGMASGLITPFILPQGAQPAVSGYPSAAAAYISGLIPSTSSEIPTIPAACTTISSDQLAAQVGAFQTIPYPGMMTAGIPWY